MAKASSSKKKTKKKTSRSASGGSRSQSKKRTGGQSGGSADAAGKHLVIVESPAKAKTINKYLGPEYVVQASVGHIRDLPAKAPKGSKQPVPGVDLENRFQPTYEVLPGKKKTVTDLKKAAKNARDVWFATDLDREGEAIAWHLAETLGINPSEAKRVIFNAITEREIQRAFENPHPIDEDKVNAQQARRILDRIVGYQVSPLLWKKVARGLSAGRVQSVAVRLIVEREQEIRAFVPDEYWQVTGRFALDPQQAPALTDAWRRFIEQKDEKGKSPTIREQNAWLAEHNALKAELVELGGEKFELVSKAEDAAKKAGHATGGSPSGNGQLPGDQPPPEIEYPDLTGRVRDVAEQVGLDDVQVETTENPDGKGPAKTLRTVTGRVGDGVQYAVKSIETKRTTTRPQGPFITSTLQASAANALSFSTDRTMRIAQSLYEGVNIPGEGQVGLITYMRTDSTHLAGDAINDARGYIKGQYGESYLPEKPNFFGSSNKAAQEAHEAIRPTDVRRSPESIAKALNEEQLKIYRLIWRRFVACQMSPAQWDSTTVLFERSDQPTGAVFKATGRVLVFDGHYKVMGVPTASDEQTLPELTEKQAVAPFDLQPEQKFTSPPPRYSEASLVKTLESEGIGRPSTYASIIKVIQDRNYVEQRDRRFYATDLGEMVTKKLLEGFPRLMDIGYTRNMEAQLDKIEDQHADWIAMLEEFYDRFSSSLDQAMENMTHAKAETQPAAYKCPKCGSRTEYRFGKNGRFLSCSAYPDCDYAAPIDEHGQPRLPEQIDMVCPIDGSAMVLRTGRFGRFICSENYPDVEYVVNLDRKGNIKYPSIPPYITDLECEKCGAPMALRRGKRGPWLGCSKFPKCRGRMAWTKLDESQRESLDKVLEAHEKEHPQPVLRRRDGSVIEEGTPVEDLLIPGGVAELEIHPDAEVPPAKSA